MRRNSLDISAEILRIALEGARKTHLVYGANLNFSLINKYLNNLEEKGLIDYRDGRFVTTDKGADFLSHYGSLAGLGSRSRMEV